MGTASASVLLRVHSDLRFLLAPRYRGDGEVVVALDGTSTLVNVVESIGIPRTEVGALTNPRGTVPLGAAPRSGDAIDVVPVERPQPGAERGFLLDVHLGGLARRMRLLGLDTAYSNEATDRQLVRDAATSGRILLTQDRGLLRRRVLPRGALVRGRGTEAQLDDVLSRFRPRLQPWTRCLVCNGRLAPVDRADIAHLLQPGTLATYNEFAQCQECGRPYWRGAHAQKLHRRVGDALATGADQLDTDR